MHAHAVHGVLGLSREPGDLGVGQGIRGTAVGEPAGSPGKTPFPPTGGTHAHPQARAKGRELAWETAEPPGSLAVLRELQGSAAPQDEAWGRWGQHLPESPDPSGHTLRAGLRGRQGDCLHGAGGVPAIVCRHCWKRL